MYSGIPKVVCIWLSAAMLLYGCRFAMAQEADVLEKSPLIDLVTRHVVEHPDASGSEVAAFANARLAEYGIDYDATRIDDASTAPTEQILEVDARRFIARVAEVPETSPCGAYYLESGQRDCLPDRAPPCARGWKHVCPARSYSC
jgi:hypothetical protein